MASRNRTARRPRLDHESVKIQMAMGANNNASIAEENQMRCLL